MLFQLRKKNIELNDEYNKLVDEKARFEVEYQRMKEKIERFEKFEKQESESLEVLVKSVRDTSIKINVFVMIIIMTSKKLLDSSILIDEKNSNIAD